MKAAAKSKRQPAPINILQKHEEAEIPFHLMFWTLLLDVAVQPKRERKSQKVPIVSSFSYTFCHPAPLPSLECSQEKRELLDMLTRSPHPIFFRNLERDTYGVASKTQFPKSGLRAMSQEIQAVNIPDFMDVKLIFALIGVSFAPVLLLAQTIVVNILPHLASFKKPTKLVFHLFHAIPELLSFLLLWAFYIIPVLRNIVGNETFPAYDNPGFTFKVIIAVDYYYVMAYTVELLFNYSVMQTMLIIHHTTAIVITLTASYLILATTDNLLLTEYIMLSGTSAVLHASVDFIPHFYLILRQFKAPQTLTRFFGMVSIWPLTIFRLAVNIFFVVIVRYFVTTVFRELTPIFYGWTIFTSVMTAVLAVTQYWAHGVYVKIQKKDQRREGTTASQEYELDKVRASITSLGSTDV